MLAPIITTQANIVVGCVGWMSLCLDNVPGPHSSLQGLRRQPRSVRVCMSSSLPSLHTATLTFREPLYSPEAGFELGLKALQKVNRACTPTVCPFQPPLTLSTPHLPSQSAPAHTSDPPFSLSPAPPCPSHYHTPLTSFPSQMTLPSLKSMSSRPPRILHSHPIFLLPHPSISPPQVLWMAGFSPRWESVVRPRPL